VIGAMLKKLKHNIISADEKAVGKIKVKPDMLTVPFPNENVCLLI